MIFEEAWELEAMSLKLEMVALSNLVTPVSISVRSSPSFLSCFSSSFCDSSAVLDESERFSRPSATLSRTSDAPVFGAYS